MNYYERIQSAIDFAEQNLEKSVTVQDIAKHAYMSVSNFYRLFFAITGFQAKEYLINRRISNAAAEIKSTNFKVIDLAVKFAYESPDSFSRTFKKLAGCNPNAYKNADKSFVFERINVMDKYFINDNDKSAEKYPEIKVMRNLEDMRVAYYCFYGKNPEDGAFQVIKKWVLENKLDINNGGYRIFGYNAPDSDTSAEEYGYEVCVTIPADMTVEEGLIKTKILNGGLYAIVSIDAGENLGEAIISGWKRFSKWLDGSRYIYGKSQWLEEHLGFDNDFEHCGGIDLYMPVMPKTDLDKLELVEENINPFTAATYTAKGRNAENKARKYLFDWAQKQNIEFSDENVRVFATYDNQLIGSPSFWYKLLITVSCDVKVSDKNIVIESFIGGTYLRREVNYRINAQSWYNFIQTVTNSKKYDFGCHPFLEEYLISKPNINEDTDIAQHMPINLK